MRRSAGKPSRKTNRLLEVNEKEQVLRESLKAPSETRLGSSSTKPLIPKYNPQEGCSIAEAKGIWETMR